MGSASAAPGLSVPTQAPRTLLWTVWLVVHCGLSGMDGPAQTSAPDSVGRPAAVQSSMPSRYLRTLVYPSAVSFSATRPLLGQAGFEQYVTIAAPRSGSSVAACAAT